MANGATHYRMAEQLAAEAYRRLGQEDEQAAEQWAAVAQVFATLANTAAVLQARHGSSDDAREWQDALAGRTRQERRRDGSPMPPRRPGATRDPPPRVV